MADIMYGGAITGGDLLEENYTDFYGAVNNNNARPRYPGLYVGNLTWWTTDQDVINAINSVGITDVQEVKFFENRNNGQSKGFCVVTFNSEASLPTVMEKLPKLELYGQNPVVTPYNRQNLNLFESQTKIRPQINSNNGPNSHAAGIMGISSISGVHTNTQNLPYPNMNTYNQSPGFGGPRGSSSFHTNMRLPMRAPRPLMRAPLPNHIIPGGHQMNRMRFMQPQPQWMQPQVSMDISAQRLDNKQLPDDGGIATSSRRDDGGSYSSRRDDRSRREPDDSGITTSSRRDESGSYSSSARREERSKRESDNSSVGTSSRREEGSSSSRRTDDRSRREERSFRREEKSSLRSRTDDRVRSRSRERSRERKERRDRRERY